jgi:hypothetical protein
VRAMFAPVRARSLTPLVAASSSERANATEPERTPNLAILATLAFGSETAPSPVRGASWNWTDINDHEPSAGPGRSRHGQRGLGFEGRFHDELVATEDHDRQCHFDDWFANAYEEVA